MKKSVIFIAVFLVFSPVLAFSQNNPHQTKLLSESQKATCSDQQVKQLTDDLDADGEEFIGLIMNLASAAQIKEQNKKDEAIKISKRAMLEKNKVINKKMGFLMKNCGITYKSKRTRQYEVENAQRKLEEKRDSYKPEDAYKPDLAPSN